MIFSEKVFDSGDAVINNLTRVKSTLDILNMKCILILVFIIMSSCQDNNSIVNHPGGENQTDTYPKNPVARQIVFGAADSGGSEGSFAALETALQAHGADHGFKFGAIRSYLIYNSGLDPALLPYTAKNQGISGRQYIPLISFRTRISGDNHLKYPQVWAGINDVNWKMQLDQIATQYGTTESPVSGPAGTKAYPVILAFNHEFDLTSESGFAYDSTCYMADSQQYAKAFRNIQDLQRAYKPGLNVKWTCLPTAYSIRDYTGTGLNPVFDYWPSRNANGTGGSIDDGTPDLLNISGVDIMGCDAYMNDFTFAEAVNKGDVNAKSSFINMVRSVGPLGSGGIPWLIAEWGIDERCGDTNWKKNTFDAMMTNLASADYQGCVYLTMWPTGTSRNDNRWNSPPKDADGNCPYPWPSSNSNGISALGFTAHFAKGVALPGGRPNLFNL